MGGGACAHARHRQVFYPINCRLQIAAYRKFRYIPSDFSPPPPGELVLPMERLVTPCLCNYSNNRGPTRICPSVRLFLTRAGPCGTARRRLYKKRPPPGTRGQFMSRSEAARGRPRLRRSPRRGPDARPGPREKAVSTTGKATSSIAMMRRRASAVAAVAALGILERRFTCCRRRMIANTASTTLALHRLLPYTG